MQDKKQVNEVKKTSVSIPTLETFLKAGAHFGHKTSAWNPRMEEYIYDQKDGMHIIDIIKTIKCLKEALAKIEDVVDHSNVLLVGTKGQAATIVEKVANETGAFYINNRWAGGLFTNFDIIKKGLERLVKLEEILASGGGDHTKKELLLMQREVDRLNRIYAGIKLMEQIPKLVIVVDSKVETIAIKESAIVGVPVVALLDTNCDPTLVDYPIPANDDSIKSITLFVELLGEAVKKGRKSQLLVATRKNYYAQLDSVKRDYANKLAREEAMHEEEKSRIRRLKVGEGEKSFAEKDVKVNIPRQVLTKAVENKSKAKTKTTAKPKTKVSKPKAKVTTKVTTKVKATTKKKKGFSKGVLDLHLGPSVQKSLEEAGLLTKTALKAKTEEELLELKGVGKKAVEKIMASL